MNLVGLLDRLRRPARSFEVPLELRVLHHALEILLGLREVHDHNLIVTSGADVGHSTRLFAGYRVLQLPVVVELRGFEPLASCMPCRDTAAWPAVTACRRQ
jgi:hypothetical protein